MNKFKAGDKVVLEIKGISKNENYIVGLLDNQDEKLLKKDIDYYATPLSDYIKEAKNDALKLLTKINEELSCVDLNKIFGVDSFQDVLEKYDYDEIIRRVQNWEKDEKKIKVGDIVRHEGENGRIAIVTKCLSDRAYLLFLDGSSGMYPSISFQKINITFSLKDFMENIIRNNE